MNIFVLDRDPVLAAQYQCDRHVVKMVLETAQLLCSAYQHDNVPYRRTHLQHPCSLWARDSKANYTWLIAHGLALAREYTYRYEKVHKSEAVIRWCMDNPPLLPDLSMTNFALVMPEQYRMSDVVESYRYYYRVEKRSIATWKKKRPCPAWF